MVVCRDRVLGMFLLCVSISPWPVCNDAQERFDNILGSERSMCDYVPHAGIVEERHMATACPAEVFSDST